MASPMAEMTITMSAVIPIRLSQRKANPRHMAVAGGDAGCRLPESGVGGGFSSAMETPSHVNGGPYQFDGQQEVAWFIFRNPDASCGPETGGTGRKHSWAA